MAIGYDVEQNAHDQCIASLFIQNSPFYVALSPEKQFKTEICWWCKFDVNSILLFLEVLFISNLLKEFSPTEKINAMYYLERRGGKFGSMVAMVK